jgi:hypothetical protein
MVERVKGDRKENWGYVEKGKWWGNGRRGGKWGR